MPLLSKTMLPNVPQRDNITLSCWAGFVLLGLFLAHCQAAEGPAGRRPTRLKPVQHAWDPTEFHMGDYIWAKDLHDKQVCRLWKAFEIPAGHPPTNARLRILADNSYTLLLDGRSIGRGSDYHYLTEYDLTDSLAPGHHTIAVIAFNETHQAGLSLGFDITFAEASPLHIRSNESWRIAPPDDDRWDQRWSAPRAWEHAVLVAPFGSAPWDAPPMRIQSIAVPLAPTVPTWQRTWVLALVGACAAAGLLASLVLKLRLMNQNKAQILLDRERSRIARDLHDGLGAGLTQLVLACEVARNDVTADTEHERRLADLCDHAREIAGSIDELVWSVNSGRDTLRDFVSYTSKYVQRFLQPTPILCRLGIADTIPDLDCNLAIRRNLLLAVKEALNNAVKYSGATELRFGIQTTPRLVVVTIADNGSGFVPHLKADSGHGLKNLRERVMDVGGRCHIDSDLERGTTITFEVPLQTALRIRSSKVTSRMHVQRGATRLETNQHAAEKAVL